MAKARALDKRRKSIRNIRKITRTMELVATAQYKRALTRVQEAEAYTRRIVALVRDLAKTGLEVPHPLLEEHAETKSGTLLVLTSNRGMCGGYNTSIFRLARPRWREFEQELETPTLEVSGKRGISAFSFREIGPSKTYTNFEGKPSFDDVNQLADRYMEAYQTGELDRLDVAYTKFENTSNQYPIIETLLPITELVEPMEEDDEEIGDSIQYEFLPSPESILQEVVPTAFRVKLFKCFLDAAVSEQIARMVAMKSATENADQMISDLTMAYNRARQSQITGEILEILSGAEALEGK
jgi:F-type H+-transporting ATPase subunit gamma